MVLLSVFQTVDKMARILVACEESQAVTKELRFLGHDAFSCDILPCSGGHPEWHVQRDVAQLLAEKWDMIIAFPPCTHLATSGARWFKQKQQDGRQQQGIDFFMQFVNADCERIAIENPVGIMSTKYRKPDQIIQPWMFGDPFQKSTCLWLKNLPPLTPTEIVDKGEFKEWVDSKTGRTKRQSVWSYKLPGDGHNRSKTFSGIAKAMATQWGGLV
jgi:site-specific DNA-cytosine methylase